MDLQTVKNKLLGIFLNRTGINFEEKAHLKESKLLSKDIYLPVRELIFILYDVEREFGISIPKEYVIKGEFCTYSNIEHIVLELCI